ncbi:bifunctional lysylphosphatidylglycerol flippase/synthetase MprF [Bacillus sp. FJAT-49711]|uniref:bifunctional lysylphosphatidylglycerol flippase/synthetase MprF n=1 Tax=Bacillus sp. FJAT-49711 TaxID=2833585 RepID=UPI001BC95A96|nr:bifunctional lysylphosphatidylglycerol flippase/synthetase MprF [Bacillus sp. FJAT-49711]MBS4219875.1 bifunctional lysylphosphatidylglycerol flippase/synthetase MprF [Bacillus sp. FJAT-49711]
MKIEKKQLFQVLKISFPLLLLILAVMEIQKSVKGVDLNLLQQEVSQLQIWELALFFIIALCAVSPMFLYDVMIVRLLGIKISRRRLVKQSFIVNTFSNIIGFGGLVGLLLRSYFYTKYDIEKQGLLKTIASVTLFYLTGISLIAWIIPIGYRNFPLFQETKWLMLAVLAVILYLPLFIGVYIFQNKRKSGSPLKLQVAGKLVIASALEWAAVFFVIWYLTHLLHIPVPLSSLIPIFVIASCAGIVSMIPGGIGSFDLVFLWGMQIFGILDEKVLFLLILYRLGYFILPFLFAVILFIKEYWDKWNRSWNDLPNIFFQRVSHISLTVLIFISGLILLLSAAVPGVLYRLKIAEGFLSQPIMQISHQMTVAAGFILLGLCRGIEYKVKRAYYLSILVLSFAAIFSVLKGIDYEETIFLLIVAALLFMSKKRFYRESYVITWGKGLFDITVVLIITAMYIFIGYMNLPTSKFNIPARLRPLVITDYYDLFYSGIIGIVIAAFILVLGYFIRKPKLIVNEPSTHQEEKIMEHIKKHTGTVLSHLIFLHDKFVFWNKKETVLFSYQTYADKIIILGDPVGIREDFPSAIEEFLESADRFGYRLVFYEASNKVIPHLHEYGFDFFKLGEEAFVDLDEFALTGKKMKGKRAIKNKFEKGGYWTELIDPPFQTELLQQLKEVSDKWLHGRSEKGFSLGYYDEHYLSMSKVIVVRGEEGIIGFASIMPMYDDEKTISIDLMRFIPDAPSGTMDYIFICLFEWAKESGYRTFNLGMAPLSNVGQSKFSFLSERMAAQLFLHGHFLYHFKGLRNFKEKYADKWEPKYLAYRKKSSLTFTMAQVTLLISKKRD